MLPLGHLALGYIVAMLSNNLLELNSNILFVWFFSLFPDFDVFIPEIEHRGPTHSGIFTLVLIISLIVFNSPDNLPYVFVLVSHVISDYVTDPGIMMFWPFSSDWFKSPISVSMRGSIETAFEIILFVVFIIFIYFSSEFNYIFTQSIDVYFLLSLIFGFVLTYIYNLTHSVPRILILPHFVTFSIMAIYTFNKYIKF